MAKVIKEIIIMLVICLLTMLVLAIALYRYIPNRKAVPEVVTYTASEDVQDLLEDNIDTKSDQDNVILTSSDLSGYQSTNTYVPGKSNPFAPASSSVSTDGGSDNNNSGDNNGNTENNGASQNNEQKNPNHSTESTAPSIYNGKGTK